MPDPNDELAELAVAADDHNQAMALAKSSPSLGGSGLPDLGGEIRSIDVCPEGLRLRLGYGRTSRIGRLTIITVFGVGFVVLGVWSYPLVKPGALAFIPMVIGALVLLMIPLVAREPVVDAFCELDGELDLVRFQISGMAEPEEVPMDLLAGVVFKQVELLRSKTDAVTGKTRFVPAGVSVGGVRLVSTSEPVSFDPDRAMPFHLCLDYGGLEQRIGTSRDGNRLLEIGTRIANFLHAPLRHRKGVVEV